jgi:hypothetical protein
MKGKGTPAVMAAILLSVGQPASAAQEIGHGGRAIVGTGGFAGVNVRLGFRNGAVDPIARLRLGISHLSSDGGPASTLRLQHGSAVELGFSRLGGADLFVGGQKLRDMQSRFGLTPASTSLFIVGGLALGAVAVAAMAGGDSESTPERPRSPCPPGVEVCTQ